MTHGGPFLETLTVCVHGPLLLAPRVQGYGEESQEIVIIPHRMTCHLPDHPSNSRKGLLLCDPGRVMFPWEKAIDSWKPSSRKQREPRSSKPSRMNLPDKRQARRRKWPEEGPSEAGREVWVEEGGKGGDTWSVVMTKVCLPRKSTQRLKNNCNF